MASSKSQQEIEAFSLTAHKELSPANSHTLGSEADPSPVEPWDDTLIVACERF